MDGNCGGVLCVDGYIKDIDHGVPVCDAKLFCIWVMVVLRLSGVIGIKQIWFELLGIHLLLEKIDFLLRLDNPIAFLRTFVESDVHMYGARRPEIK